MQSDDKLNISLTAHVLIALTETADKLTGDVKRFSNTGQFVSKYVYCVFINGYKRLCLYVCLVMCHMLLF